MLGVIKVWEDLNGIMKPALDRVKGRSIVRVLRHIDVIQDAERH